MKVMLMNTMIMVLGMKGKLRMVKDMEKVNSSIKLVVFMMGNGKMVRLMDLELYTTQVAISHITVNGKMKCLMAEELSIMITQRLMKNLISGTLLTFPRCGLNIKEISNMMQNMVLEHFILLMGTDSLVISWMIRSMERVNIQKQIVLRANKVKRLLAYGNLMY